MKPATKIIVLNEKIRVLTQNIAKLEMAHYALGNAIWFNDAELDAAKESACATLRTALKGAEARLFEKQLELNKILFEMESAENKVVA